MVRFKDDAVGGDGSLNAQLVGATRILIANLTTLHDGLFIESKADSSRHSLQEIHMRLWDVTGNDGTFNPARGVHRIKKWIALYRTELRTMQQDRRQRHLAHIPVNDLRQHCVALDDGFWTITPERYREALEARGTRLEAAKLVVQAGLYRLPPSGMQEDAVAQLLSTYDTQSKRYS